MRIQHNLNAMNSLRQLGANNNATGKNLEKLSSGYRINRAGDDAAGLAISEKMRGQIRGLEQAQQNAEDGISLIQTAEGGLNETHAILQRMRELAVQSSNGTYDDDVDRKNLDKEVQALKTEIDRIAESTKFNGKSLLDGSINGSINITASSTAGNADFTVEGLAKDSVIKIATAASASTANETAISYDESTNTLTIKLEEGLSVTQDVINTAIEAYKTTATVGSETEEVLSELKITLNGDAFTAATVDANSTGVSVDTEALTLQIGANGTSAEKVALSVKNMGMEGLKLSDVDVLSDSGAKSAIDVIDEAINTVSSTRADLGALQNRLEHTVNNLGVTSENLTAAESRIRDVDMAKEMMEYTKNNILTQAAQAMLAQANQQPQGVLQLLQ